MAAMFAIDAHTQHPAHCQPQPGLPVCFRLGHTTEGGAPVIMPLPWAHSLRIVPKGSSSAAHQQALELAEHWLLQLLLQAPATHLEVFVYDTSLDTSLPTLERLAGTAKARGLPQTIHFIADAANLQTQLELWQGDARQRKSHLLQSGHGDWGQLMRSEAGQPQRLVVITHTEDLLDVDRRLAALPALVQHGPRLGYWFWIVGSAQTPAALRNPPEREHRRAWFDGRVSPQTLRFGVDDQGRIALPPEWQGSPAAKVYGEWGAIQGDGLSPADRQAVFDRYLALHTQPQASAAEDAWRIPVGRFQGQPYAFRMGPRNGAYNALLGGTVGTGKSSFLNLLIARTCEAHSPDEFQFYLFDLKQGLTFSLFEGVPHVTRLYMNQQDAGNVLQTLRDLLRERDRRAKRFSAVAPAGLVPDIGAYNRVARERGVPRMPYLAVVIDEAQKLFTEGDFNQRREVTQLVEQVAREGRAFGFMLLLASQTFLNVDMPAAAQNQFRMRLALGLDTDADCRKLLGPDNNAPMQLPQHHLLVNDDAGRVNANRVVALDHLEPQAIYHRMQAIRERYPLPEGHQALRASCAVTDMDAASDLAMPPAQPRATAASAPVYQPGAYAQYRKPAAPPSTE